MQAQFTLTADGLSPAGANSLSEILEESASPPLAVTINETDEEQNLWNIVAYFGDEAHARLCAGRLVTLAHMDNGKFSIAPVPDVDWVRWSLKGLAPVVAGRFYLYGSHDRARRRAGGISLEIDADPEFAEIEAILVRPDTSDDDRHQF